MVSVFEPHDVSRVRAVHKGSVRDLSIKKGDLYFADLSPVMGSEPVSYTHLDVYKRQV